jgi:type 1 fimbria pilin
MRRFLNLAGAAALAVALFSMPQAEAGKAGKEVTLTGTLVDTKCYSMMPAANKGNDHMTPQGQIPSCATACASMGIPVGILTAEGDLVVLIAPAPALSPHLAKNARVTGTISPDGNSVVAGQLEVQEGEQWQEVAITTMM